MTQFSEAPPRELRFVRLLIGLAILSALVAGIAGAILVLTDPVPGSTSEGVLAITAASGGFGAAGFAAAAAIYAQIKNLWRHAPTWVRVVAWIFIAISVLWSVTRPMV